VGSDLLTDRDGSGAPAALLNLAGRARGRLAFTAGLCLAGAALGEIAGMGTSGWIHRQLFDVRLSDVRIDRPDRRRPGCFFLVLERRPPAGSGPPTRWCSPHWLLPFPLRSR
jgi:hypothetical protein